MTLLPPSPVLQKSNTSIPWKQLLLKSFEANYHNNDQVYISMATMKRSGDISMHCIQFKGFVKQDVRFFKFMLAMNDNKLMGDIKSDPNAKLSWIMPKTKEYFNFKGRFYIASAPIQVTRFPPPKITDDDEPASDFWEEQRLLQWKELDPKSRAIFTWPSRGDIPKASDVAFTCQSLKQNDTTVVHDIAMDNFCLLVYKVTDVEHFDYTSFPPKRTVYQLNIKENTWNIQAANP